MTIDNCFIQGLKPPLSGGKAKNSAFEILFLERRSNCQLFIVNCPLLKPIPQSPITSHLKKLHKPTYRVCAMIVI
ncbi:MAG: hypothetical protein ACKO2Z_25625 [Sphaerospermopsis kisseleviana]